MIEFSRNPANSTPIVRFPMSYIFTDREDGKLWLLSFETQEESADGTGHIILTDAIPRRIRLHSRTYPAGEEPTLGGNPSIRLFVRDGRLGYEVVPLPRPEQDKDQGRVLARQGLSSEFREIIIPSSWEKPSDRLGWTVIDD